VTTTAQKFVPSDQAIREKAIQSERISLNVEAGAGTGKTSLLVGRYLHLVSKGLSRPTKIVTITFTDEAASELRERIRTALHNKHLESSLEELDRAPISTIHSFAASMLRERPFEAGIDPNFEQLDALGSELFLVECYDRWITLASEKNSRPLTRALASSIKLEKIRTLAFSLYKHRDLLHLLPTRQKRPNVAKFFLDFECETQSLWKMAQAACVDTQDQGFRAIEELHQEIIALEGSSLDIKERALLMRLKPQAKGNQSKWARAEQCKEQKERMKALLTALQEIQLNIRENIFSELLSWLSEFAIFVEKEKKRQSKLDFDDLLLITRKLLKENSEVRGYFQNRYQYILVDEFQDTDPIQAEIIWHLSSQTVSTNSWSELEIEPGKLFLVGDPKQSIYRFRGASIETYSATTKQIKRQGDQLFIQQNFRSNQPLIDWINQVFHPILKETYTPLKANPHHATLPHQKPVIVLEAPDYYATSSAQEIRCLEAEAISAFLRKLIDDSKPQVFDPIAGLRSIKPGDIAVLFPTKTEIDIFEEHFRRYELPFSLEGGNLFYHRAEIHGLLASLEAITHPTDSVSVVAALRSVVFGLSDQDLLTIVKKNRSFDYRVAKVHDLPQPIPSAYLILRDLHQKYLDQSPSHTISELLYKTLAIPLSMGRYHGEQAAANLEKLVSLARHHENHGLDRLDQFVSWVRERTQNAEQQSESPLSEEHGERMRLLTVHRSKGLEFPVVVLANLTVEANQTDNVIADRFRNILALGMGAKGSRFATSNYEEALLLEKELREGEKKRLLYVAATRAKDLLVLPRFIRARQTGHSFWRTLDQGFEKGQSLVEVRPFASLKLRDNTVNQTPKPDDPKRKTSGIFQKERQILVHELAARYESLIPGLPLQTATALIHADRTSSQQTTQQSSENVAQEKDRKGSSARMLGLALHSVLEHIDFSNTKDMTNICRITALEMGIPEKTRDLETLVKKSIESPIFSRIQAAKKKYREVPFSWKHNGRLFEGVIDLVLEEEDGLVVIDYKTDSIKPSQLKERTEMYTPQISLYIQALESITKKKVKEGLLFFVQLQKTSSIEICFPNDHQPSQ